MSQIVSNVSKEGGNTNPPPITRIRSRRYCLTLNNYSEDELSQMTSWFESRDIKYIIGQELGEECKTPHLQIYIESKNQLDFNTLKKMNKRLHIEKAKGNRDANIRYCSKERVYKSTFPVPIKIRILNSYNDVVWRKWQNEVIDIINTTPDSRTIHWVYDPVGNAGKSFLVKYLVLKYDAILCDGKKNDIFNAIKVYMDTHDEVSPCLVLLDIPRYQNEYVNYGVIEQLKNGLLYSGKYEGGLCVFEHPHVFVFSNQLPKYEAMSEDRWNMIPILKRDRN